MTADDVSLVEAAENQDANGPVGAYDNAVNRALGRCTVREGAYDPPRHDRLTALPDGSRLEPEEWVSSAYRPGPRHDSALLDRLQKGTVRRSAVLSGAAIAPPVTARSLRAARLPSSIPCAPRDFGPARPPSHCAMAQVGIWMPLPGRRDCSPVALAPGRRK